MQRLKQFRAGEQGRGFAIVADEVRKLAEQSSESSMEIGSLIKEIQADVHETVKAMNEVGVEVQSGIKVANDTKQSFMRFQNLQMILCQKCMVWWNYLIQ